MWGDDYEIERALRGDEIPREVSRARVLAGLAILAAVAIVAAAGIFMTQVG